MDRVYLTAEERDFIMDMVRELSKIKIDFLLQVMSAEYKDTFITKTDGKYDNTNHSAVREKLLRVLKVITKKRR